jgi:hypothetical protein
MFNYLWTLAYVVIINFTYVLFAIFLWYNIWVKKHGGIYPLSLNIINLVEIPIEKNVTGLDKR